jgi:hypothetical protein
MSGRSAYSGLPRRRGVENIVRGERHRSLSLPITGDPPAKTARLPPVFGPEGCQVVIVGGPLAGALFGGVAVLGLALL